jgi:secreted PhoX family phosphatase
MKVRRVDLYRLGAPALALAALLPAAAPAVAGTIFDNFTPLPTSVAAGSLPEDKPFQLSSPNFVQRTINANDLGPQNGGVKLGDNWDMNTLNENGPQTGRYLFAPFETGTAGVRRLDLHTLQAVTIVPEGTQGFVAGDASRWTPFGTYLTAEESWTVGGGPTPKGRLFEVTNPLAAPGSVNFTSHNVVPRVSHEGLAFDKDKNMYFVDEFNGGAIYKYTSATPQDGATYFNAGQTFVLKVGAGANFEATGAATWVPITDANGNALPGIPTVDLGGGVVVVDGRAAADVASIGGTGFNRPEDLEIQTLANGSQVLYFAATGNHKTFSIGLDSAAAATVKLFVDRNTVNMLTSLAVGTDFTSPDNLAIDAEGHIYIIEDQPGGLADIWFALDGDLDGIAEAIGRWASMSTLGAEPTGLYFDPYNPDIAYVNVQHAASDVDRTIEIRAVPEPASLGLLLAGLGAVAGFVRRRNAERTA